MFIYLFVTHEQPSILSCSQRVKLVQRANVAKFELCLIIVISEDREMQ